MQLPTALQGHHPIFHVSVFKLYTDDIISLLGCRLHIPTSEWVDGVQEYVVERILKRDLVAFSCGPSKNKLYQDRFLVKWQGYADFESTWEPYEHFVSADGTVNAALLAFLASEHRDDVPDGEGEYVTRRI